MAITRQSHDHHMTITWPSHGHHMTITWPSHGHHMTITWKREERGGTGQRYFDSTHTLSTHMYMHRHELTLHLQSTCHTARQSACYTTGHTPQHFNVNANVCLERTNLLGQMRPLKLWKVLDVPQVVMVIATFLATYSCRTGDSL